MAITIRRSLTVDLRLSTTPGRDLQKACQSRAGTTITIKIRPGQIAPLELADLAVYGSHLEFIFDCEDDRTLRAWHDTAEYGANAWIGAGA